MIALRPNGRLTPLLAIAGTVLLWLPLLAPVVFGLFSLFATGTFRFDYLMPAELFPVALIGGGLLLWASIRVRSRVATLAWTLSIAFLALAGGQLWAVVSGLASGDIPAQGWPWMLALASLALYTLGILVAAGIGVLLVVDLLRRPDRG